MSFFCFLLFQLFWWVINFITYFLKFGLFIPKELCDQTRRISISSDLDKVTDGTWDHTFTGRELAYIYLKKKLLYYVRVNNVISKFEYR